MAPACVKLWTRCLQDLQQLPAVNNDPAAVAVISVKLHATLTQWRELPPLSARDWRKLVLEVKVWGQHVYADRFRIQLQFNSAKITQLSTDKCQLSRSGLQPLSGCMTVIRLACDALGRCYNL